MLHQLITGINPAEKPFFFEKITAAEPGLLKRCRGEERRKLLGLERVIADCTRFRREDRCQSAETVLEELKDPDGRLFAGRRGKRQLFTAVVLLGLGFLFSVLSVRSEQQMQQCRLEGRDFCLKKLLRAEEEQTDQWMQAALQLAPGDAVCFSAYLDRMLTDGIFSGQEQIRMRKMLDQKAHRDAQDQETLLHRNAEGCFRFSYRMGTACLYGAEGSPDYTAAGNWLKEAEDSGKAWKPEGDGLKQEKQQLLKRIRILIRICSYRGKVLSGGLQNEGIVSLPMYWKELTGLLEEDLPAGNLLITELGLWREILGLLTDWPSELRRNGVGWGEQREAAERIRNFAGILQNSREAEEYPAVGEQLKLLQHTAEAAERKRLLLEEAEKKEEGSQE